MRVYKFRSLQNFEHVADIFCNHRFYAAQFFDLNDPMEGMFHAKPDTKKEYLEKIHEGKRNLRICSFSQDFRNLLLWAHYADGFKGICIEVELNDWPDQEVTNVHYDSYRLIFSNDQGQYAHYWPTMILKEKNTAWKYEKEIRILTKKEFVTFPGVEIKSVLLGHRTSDSIREALFRLVPKDAKVWQTKISESTNRVIKAQQLNPADAKRSNANRSAWAGVSWLKCWLTSTSTGFTSFAALISFSGYVGRYAATASS
ncbi:MAG: DUF2971 domain-containing protein [Anaerolineae bacterium]|nr:DUF2971 domain-containing protein [Anaerolineae bacterium]MCP5428555.1 DUF2971 domain-containing protein [Chromatiaceae bacterium]